MSSQPEYQPLRIFLVDDHTVVRQGTRDMLSQMARLQVVGEAASTDQLLGQLRLKQPEVLFLDINLPGQSGLDVLPQIRVEFPDLVVVMFTAHGEAQYIKRALQLGAKGYISKTVSEEALQGLINTLWEGVHGSVPFGKEPILSPDVLEIWLASQGKKESGNPMITPREEEILILIAQGLTNKEIAEQLCLSVKTVDSHVANMMKKINVNNRSQLTAFAYEHRYI